MRGGARLAAARALRRTTTPAERALWARLRARGLAGWKFRRQAPLGPYVADFLCAEALLVVEVDGGQHGASPSDAARDALLAENGCAVARYWNNEVLSNMDGVLSDLAARLAARALTPALSRRRERGRAGETCSHERPEALPAGAAAKERAPSASTARTAPISPPLPPAGEGRGEGAGGPSMSGARA